MLTAAIPSQFPESPGSQGSGRTVGKDFLGKSDQHTKEVPKILSILLSKSSELMTCCSTRFTYITFFFYLQPRRENHIHQTPELKENF